MDLLDTGFRLFPVAAELRFARHGSLIACKPLLVFSEGIERLNIATIGQSGKTRDAYVDTDDAGCRPIPLQTNMLLREPCGISARL